jgi:GT2 family glycosyltransferase
MPDHIYFDYPQTIEIANIRRKCFAVTGACVAISSKLYNEIKLSEEYHYGWEDIDLANEIKSRGYDIYYEPTSVVYHYESKTPGRYSAESDNFMAYMSKWVFYPNKLNRKTK